MDRDDVGALIKQSLKWGTPSGLFIPSLCRLALGLGMSWIFPNMGSQSVMLSSYLDSWFWSPEEVPGGSLTLALLPLDRWSGSGCPCRTQCIVPWHLGADVILAKREVSCFMGIKKKISMRAMMSRPWPLQQRSWRTEQNDHQNVEKDKQTINCQEF